MKRKITAVILALVLALTVGTLTASAAAAESLETFDYMTYAEDYPDLYALYVTKDGVVDAKGLYDHYVNVGRAEGRKANFVEGLDPLPPLKVSGLVDWFEARTFPDEMSNARLLAEYDRLMAFIEAHNELYLEPVMARENELMSEMKTRMRHYEWKDTESPEFKRAVATSMAPLYKYLGRPNMDLWEEWDD